jgi:hypothetical protein
VGEIALGSSGYFDGVEHLLAVVDALFRPEARSQIASLLSRLKQVLHDS